LSPNVKTSIDEPIEITIVISPVANSVLAVKFDLSELHYNKHCWIEIFESVAQLALRNQMLLHERCRCDSCLAGARAARQIYNQFVAEFSKDGEEPIRH